MTNRFFLFILYAYDFLNVELTNELYIDQTHLIEKKQWTNKREQATNNKRRDGMGKRKIRRDTRTQQTSRQLEPNSYQRMVV